ncbi:MAG: DUF362 domain-containing protein [Planctomycetota bacterium]
MARPNPVTRRDFLKASIAIAAVGAVGAPALAQDKASKVVDIRNPAWRNADHEVNASIVKQMVEDGVKTFSGKDNIDEAWRSFVSPNEKICVKFNVLSDNYTLANQALVDAITQGLMSAGAKKENLFVVEAVDAAFEGGGEPNLEFGPEIKIHDQTTRLTRFLTDQIDAIINIPNIKDHSIAGATLSMKNLSHAGGTFMEGPDRFHPNMCNPYIPEMNSKTPLKDKLRVSIINGLEGVFKGGPETGNPRLRWPHNGLLIGVDRVALDTVGVKLIDEARAPKGLPPLMRTGTRPVYIQTAAEMGLGVNDLSKIEWVKKTA